MVTARFTNPALYNAQPWQIARSSKNPPQRVAHEQTQWRSGIDSGQHALNMPFAEMEQNHSEKTEKEILNKLLAEALVNAEILAQENNYKGNGASGESDENSNTSENMLKVIQSLMNENKVLRMQLQNAKHNQMITEDKLAVFKEKHKSHEASTLASKPTEAKSKLCWFFVNNQCKFGLNCWNKHEPSTQEPKKVVAKSKQEQNNKNSKASLPLQPLMKHSKSSSKKLKCSKMDDYSESEGERILTKPFKANSKITKEKINDAAEKAHSKLQQMFQEIKAKEPSAEESSENEYSTEDSTEAEVENRKHSLENNFTKGKIAQEAKKAIPKYKQAPEIEAEKAKEDAVIEASSNETVETVNEAVDDSKETVKDKMLGCEEFHESNIFDMAFSKALSELDLQPANESECQSSEDIESEEEEIKKRSRRKKRKGKGKRKM
jgi:hypothetical protein